MTRATHIHQWNWMEGLGHHFSLQDSSVPLILTLGSFFCSFALDFFMCNFTLHPEQCLENNLHQHAGKYFADVTSDSQLIVDFLSNWWLLFLCCPLA